MSFPIDLTVPNVNDFPANDVPGMNGNFININGFLSVDHTHPGSPNDGTHQKVSYLTFNSTPAPTGQTGVAYVAAGLALNTAPQNYFTNSQGTYPLSAIKAFGQFTTTAIPNPPVFTNSYNIDTASATHTSGSYVIPLVANAVFGNNVLFFFSFSNSNSGVGIPNYAYTFTAPNLTLTFVAPPVGNLVNILAIQI